MKFRYNRKTKKVQPVNTLPDQKAKAAKARLMLGLDTADAELYGTGPMVTTVRTVLPSATFRTIYQPNSAQAAAMAAQLAAMQNAFINPPIIPGGLYSGRNRSAPSQNNRGPGRASSGSPGGACTCSDFSFDAFRQPAWRTRCYSCTPYAGIRAGELIGYRFWRVVRMTVPALPKYTWEFSPDAIEPTTACEHKFMLKSAAHEHIWQPNVPMCGDIKRAGVFAWNNEKLCHNEARSWFSDLEEPIYVLGTVKLWGEVIEHELGYRAQRAEIRSLDSVMYAQPRDSAQRYNQEILFPSWRHVHAFDFEALKKDYIK